MPTTTTATTTTTPAATHLQLLEGNHAIALAAINAGCRFFAGYPMSPFTGLLESMAALMPPRGGTCINAESEIEGVNMALGAGATGMRAATGSCGQGIALMQEAIAEAALNETPMVVVNMARNQQDYFQCTRGGGWGDYRTPTLAPWDVAEAVAHTHRAFDLAERHRTPVLLYGDPLIAHTQATVDVSCPTFPPLPEKTWILDGSSSGTGTSRQIWTWAMGKVTDPGPGPDGQWRYIAAKFDTLATEIAESDSWGCEDADTVVVAFGTAARFVAYVVAQLRHEGHSIGWFRPVTLWPFPGHDLHQATAGARRVLVFEVNAGQMLDDVLIHTAQRERVHFIGGVSIHESGLSYGPLMDAPEIRRRILSQIGADK